MFWDLLVQDWVGLVPKRHPIVRKEQFTTARPRNFTDEQYENGSWNERDFPISVPYVRLIYGPADVILTYILHFLTYSTDSLIQLGKAKTAMVSIDIPPPSTMR